MADSLGKCVVCGGEAGVQYPLLPGSPCFCGEHHNPRDAGPFGCDFTGPDDFDIPDILEEWGPLVFIGDRETFVWTDKKGNDHKLEDIDNSYLNNIVNFLLHKAIPGMDSFSAEYWSSVAAFLEEEKARRGG